MKLVSSIRERKPSSEALNSQKSWPYGCPFVGGWADVFVLSVGDDVDAGLVVAVLAGLRGQQLNDLTRKAKL